MPCPPGGRAFELGIERIFIWKSNGTQEELLSKTSVSVCVPALLQSTVNMFCVLMKALHSPAPWHTTLLASEGRDTLGLELNADALELWHTDSTNTEDVSWRLCPPDRRTPASKRTRLSLRSAVESSDDPVKQLHYGMVSIVTAHSQGLGQWTDQHLRWDSGRRNAFLYLSPGHGVYFYIFNKTLNVNYLQVNSVRLTAHPLPSVFLSLIFLFFLFFHLFWGQIPPELQTRINN